MLTKASELHNGRLEFVAVVFFLFPTRFVSHGDFIWEWIQLTQNSIFDTFVCLGLTFQNHKILQLVMTLEKLLKVWGLCFINMHLQTKDVCIICRFGNIYGYGFAFKRGSPYTALFNVELFRLQKDFIISSLTHKWNKEKVKCEMMDNLEEQKAQG